MHFERRLAARVGFDAGYFAAFERKLFVEGEQFARRLTNFTVLLLLATVIATFGVISDSTATVIGAMIVAPLMGPIMATAAAVVLGSQARALRSLALTAAGVAGVILLSYLLAWIVPDVTIAFGANSQITSRVAPGLVALLTALASGAAGAFIISREEIADSMGGVAIAISLVPPLCVVGIALNKGQWDAALGSFLLFVTNFLAILLAGGLTFWIVGIGRAAVTDASRSVRRRAFALIVAATLLIVIPLSATTYDVIDHAIETAAANRAVDEWLTGTSYRNLAVTVQDRLVLATVEGQGELGSAGQLAQSLAAALDRPVRVSVRLVPAQVASSETAGEP